MLQRFRKRLHDVRLAFERWLLVTVFRYPPDLADALVATNQARLEHARLLRAFEQRRQELARTRDDLRARLEQLVQGASELRATREQLVAQSQRGDASPWPQAAITDLQRREDEVAEQIRQGHAMMDELRAAAVELDLAERYAGIEPAPTLH